ncbi:MAG: hypothetical protein HQ547_01210 [Candidatus Omnitrophica bacterium]|nr:hypothetical protein [Candidatus Omnitrophota bacterium]
MIEKMALFAAVTLPLWNIPLIIRMIKRRSSEDISLYWTFGVWGCLAAMTPRALVSSDPIFRIYNIVNLAVFTIVVAAVWKYRKRETK